MIVASILLGCLADLGPRSAAAFDGRCGDCHAEEQEAFDGSRHALAATGPLFLALLAEAPDPAFCEACHAPQGDDGLSCLSCHAAAGHHGPENGQLILDPTGPIRGPHGADAPHASVADGFLGDSELCGTCHDVDGPGAFDESPLVHWGRSSAADRGETCQTCHLDGHAFRGLQTDPVALLRAGLGVERVADGVRLTNRAGHRLPDGAAWARELWVEAGGVRVELHPELRVDGRATHDPFAADEVVFRGLEPDEVRVVALPEGEVRVGFRPLAAGQAERQGLAEEEIVWVW